MFYIDYVEYVFTIEMFNKFYAIGHDAILELHVSLFYECLVII